MSTTSHPAAPPSKQQRVSPIFSKSAVQNLNDHEVATYWSELSERPPVLQSLVDRICVRPELMNTSQFDDKISVLRQEMNNGGQEPFDWVALRLICIGFDLTINGDDFTPAIYYEASVPTLAEGNFYEGFQIVYDALEEWQQPLFQAALIRMMEQDSDSIQIMCGLILKGAKECHARKLDAFYKSIDRSVSDDHFVPGALSYGSPLEEAKYTLRRASHVAVDSMKTGAFHSIFVVPSEFHYAAIGSHYEGEVQIHGSNTYLAVVLATLGIKLARSPYMDDHWGLFGVANFVHALKENDLKRLWDPKNRGKSWKTIFGQHFQPTLRHRVPENRFIITDAERPRGLATTILYDTKYHSKIAPYLDAFVRHFSKEEVTNYVCNYMLSRDDLNHHLRVVFSQLASADDVNEAEGNIRIWLWDIESGEFRQDRALKLLQVIGVCK